METILIAGGTGLIGKYLAQLLFEKGYSIKILSRRKLKNDSFEYFVWDVKNNYLEEDALKDVSHIINLTGANIGSNRWTATRKKEILSSRIDSTKFLYYAVKKNNIVLKTFITSSATGFYGAITTDVIYKETDHPAQDFLGSICQKWEEASQLFAKDGIRTVQIRTGVVLSKTEGAFPKMTLPFKFRLKTILGSGEQYIPWIYIDDICNIYSFAIENKSINGPYNAVADFGIKYKDFVDLISSYMNKKIITIRIPKIILRLILGEMSLIVLEGSRISNVKIKNDGYEFKYPNLNNTLKYLV